jgi:hypothetical protein
MTISACGSEKPHTKPINNKNHTISSPQTRQKKVTIHKGTKPSMKPKRRSIYATLESENQITKNNI